MSDTWPSLPAQASANCYLDKHIASTSSESKYYIALMQKSDVRNRVDVVDVGPLPAQASANCLYWPAHSKYRGRKYNYRSPIGEKKF